jgi:predicted NBD/HSP70 family sugar kinase
MYIVIDIGGTFAKYALMDAGGSIVKNGRKRTSATNLVDFEQVIYSIIEQHDLKMVKGIALSCPGAIDVETGMIYYGGSFPFLHEVNLAKRMEEKYGIEVSIENDGKCAALAEFWLGSIKEYKDAVVLILGSGVGGGIIIDGKLHRGVNLSAGEVSYVMNCMDPATKSGNYLGLVCSSVEMIRKIAAIKNIKDPTDGKVAFEYINQQDEEANKIFNEYCFSLANQIINLQYILDPEIFAIGGGISAQPVLIERVQWAISEIKKANPFYVLNPKVVPCKFRNDSNLYGALYNFFLSKEEYDIAR